MSRAVDVAAVVLLLVALAELAMLVQHPAPSGLAVLPVVDDPADVNQLRDPTAWPRAVRARVARVGDPLTIEDLARVSLAALDGDVPGVAPLTEPERARLEPLVKAADTRRDELLKVEQQLHDIETDWNREALQILATLTPEQRAWLAEHRDEISVGEVEASYWEALDKRIDAARAAP
jgi:hypothetical protein